MKPFQSSYLKSQNGWSHFLNFCSGLLLKAFRPFKVGDIIEIDGYLGTVIHKGAFIFKINTSDDKVMTFVNRLVYTKGVNNLTTKNMMRLDLNVEVAYDSNMTSVRNTLMEIMAKNDLLLASPSPKISISRLRDRFIDLTLSPWCEPDNYWVAYKQLQRELNSGLASKGITSSEIKPGMVELRKVI